MFRKNRKHEQPSLLSDIGLMASNFFSVGSRLPILAKHIPVVNVPFLQQSHLWISLLCYLSNLSNTNGPSRR
jgi:hypothetical protein